MSNIVLNSCVFLTVILITGSPTCAWKLGPFTKLDAVNPVLLSRNDTQFLCPVNNGPVFWERKDVFNPTALIRNGQVHLLYRAEDEIGSAFGTSRIGLAFSSDGLHFERQSAPTFYPDLDSALVYEWDGGCEDPRIVEDEAGTYYMTYTAYDGKLARLFIATSKDLRTWVKHGSIFESPALIDLWSKAGSIVCRHDPSDGRFIAAKINAKYWMYWGESSIFLVWSEDLIHWTPVRDEVNGVGEHKLKAIFGPRVGNFDSDIVEPGPQSILTPAGILLIYNSRNLAPDAGGHPDLPVGTYSAGQVLLSAQDPSVVLNRTETYFMKPEKDYEIIGQVNNVVFLEGLVFFKGQWILYYGTADSKIAVAVAPGFEDDGGNGGQRLNSGIFLLALQFGSIILLAYHTGF